MCRSHASEAKAPAVNGAERRVDMELVDASEAGSRVRGENKQSIISVAALAAELLVKQWFAIGNGLAVLVAYLAPSAGATGGPHDPIVNAVCHWLVIALIFLISGLSLSNSALRAQALHWRLHVATLAFEFLVYPAVVYAIVSAARAGQGLNGHIDKFLLAGFVFLGVAPTSVASNVTMTRLSGGNEEGATIEVILSNAAGAFLTPLLVELFLSHRTGWGFIAPRSEGGGGVAAIYKKMAQQLSLIVILPLVIGQLVQSRYPERTKKVRTLVRTDRMGQSLLLVVVWSAFCSSFYSQSLQRLSPASIVFLVFVDLGLYTAITILILAAARLPGLRAKWAERARFSKQDTVALCYLGAGKGLVVGQPLLLIFYSGYENAVKGAMVVPLVVYQLMQTVLPSISVPLFRRWLREELEA